MLRWAIRCLLLFPLSHLASTHVLGSQRVLPFPFVLLLVYFLRGRPLPKLCDPLFFVLCRVHTRGDPLFGSSSLRQCLRYRICHGKLSHAGLHQSAVGSRSPWLIKKTDHTWLKYVFGISFSHRRQVGPWCLVWVLFSLPHRPGDYILTSDGLLPRFSARAFVCLSTITFESRVRFQPPPPPLCQPLAPCSPLPPAPLSLLQLPWPSSPRWRRSGATAPRGRASPPGDLCPPAGAAWRPP